MSDRKLQLPPVQKQSKSRTAETEAQYDKKFRQLEAKAKSCLVAPLTIGSFTDWIVHIKRPAYEPNSWRFIRASVRYGFERHYNSDPGQLAAALARLDTARPEHAPLREPKTSATKAKRFRPDDLDRTCNAALASGAQSGLDLALCLKSSDVCGLRPCEWPTVEFKPCEAAGYAWEMIVGNAKHDQDRGHGPTRTLRWTALNDATVAAIKAWTARAQETARVGRYETLVDTMESRMREITKALFPRRRSRPTQYTPRHECAARWKAHYCRSDMTEDERRQGLAIVAALLGHASDATASQHYGRSRRGETSRHPVPQADPKQVAKVRQRLGASFDRLADKHQTQDARP